MMIGALSNPAVGRLRGRLALALALAACAASCVPWLRVRIVQTEPPRFTVHGSLTSLFQRGVRRVSISGRPPAKPAGGQLTALELFPEVALWEIQTVDGGLRTIKNLEYGDVPDGFVQLLPQPGITALPLQPGWKYEIFVAGAGIGHESFVYEGKPLAGKSQAADSEPARLSSGDRER